MTNKGKVRALVKTKNFNKNKFLGILREEKDAFKKPLDHQEEITSRFLKRSAECGVQYVK